MLTPPCLIHLLLPSSLSRSFFLPPHLISIETSGVTNVRRAQSYKRLYGTV